MLRLFSVLALVGAFSVPVGIDSIFGGTLCEGTTGPFSCKSLKVGLVCNCGGGAFVCAPVNKRTELLDKSHDVYCACTNNCSPLCCGEAPACNPICVNN
jgi:hypothetical protein